MNTSLLFLLLLVLVPLAFYFGYRRGNRPGDRKALHRRIEEYPFYPFISNEQGIVEFSLPKFNEAVRFLLRHRNTFASRQLIIIGEQNIVRDVLPTQELNLYLSLYHRYGGNNLMAEQDRFMENYKRIVTLLGRSFRGTGIEILLHNLVNPTRSVIAIENGEVTGRKVDNGTTNLLLDLKTRKLQNQDKLNYELQIGARRFKCTTVPIFRRDYGLVGAVCINVDVNFLKEEVLGTKEKMEAFIDHIVKTDFRLSENILSQDEYQAALAGKRHFAVGVLPGTGSSVESKRLLAILFSDVMNYSAMMGEDERQALQVLDQNRKIHRAAISECRGRVLKEIGDGILASFEAASDAVRCAMLLQQRALEAGTFKLRIGIHLGEVTTTGNDVFGDGVNIASRIQSEALPGTIFLSEAVYDNVRNKIRGDIRFVGERRLKNISSPVRLYGIGTAAEA
jgi:class 3 adenylate cyclase